MPPTSKSVAIVGGGFSGALFGMKLHRAQPDWRIVIVEPGRRLGQGIAYGACAPEHLLNVPVSRMEPGLAPRFAQWLQGRSAEMADALAESESDIAAAFAPRYLFGEYMRERLAEVLTARGWSGLQIMRGEAVRALPQPRRGLLLTDGREVEADIVVLAMGNLPPRPPGGPDRWLYDTGYFVPDPWAADALEDVGSDETLLLIGTGLTMVDVVLRLARGGHRGPMIAVSRHGLLPRTHRRGGAWREFLNGRSPASPAALLRLLRDEAAKAAAAGVPWQRVFDAARPAVPGVWSGWDGAQRRQFLRHLRARWDIHRHRMAPRVSAALEKLLGEDRLEIAAGRIAGYREATSHLDVIVAARGGGTRLLAVNRVINCTGPGGDFDKIAIPLVADLRDRGVVVPDALGIGVETRDCAVFDSSGRPSDWLFALGPLTRPAWWEITAVPEITLQIDRLVRRIAAQAVETPPRLTTADFLDIGEGI